MTTLLQTLLIRTLSEQKDYILLEYFQTILPALEEHFGNTSGLGGSFISHQKHFGTQGYDTEKAKKMAQGFAKKRRSNISGSYSQCVTNNMECDARIRISSE